MKKERILAIAGKYSKLYDSIIAEMASYYLKDDKPFAVAYSAGKDSTVVADLTLKMLLVLKEVGYELHKPVFITLSDTFLEADPLIKLIDKSFALLATFIEKYELPVILKKVEPLIKESFFSLVIGKGYVLPTKQNRFCTDRMKIRPQQRDIDELKENYDGIYTITGVRHVERADRSTRIAKNTIDGMLKKHDIEGWSMLTPIENFSTVDVWNYIYSEGLEWVEKHMLGTLYAEAGNNSQECRSLLAGVEGEQPGCSKSRFGCWLCPLFETDKMLHNLGKHYHYLRKMEEFRNWLVGTKYMGWSYNRRVYKNTKKGVLHYNKDNHRNGMICPSGTTMEFRQEILRRLWALSEEVKEFRDGQPLIRDDELVEIQRLWLMEGDFDLTVQEITGKKGLLREEDKEHYALSLYMKSKLYREPEKDSVKWFQSFYMPIFGIKTQISHRWVAILCTQLLEHYNFDESVEIIVELLTGNYTGEREDTALKIVDALPISNGFFPATRETEMIVKEWERDKISFMTFIRKHENGEIEEPTKNLFGYNGDYADHFEQFKELQEKEDITLCESISLEDKMAWFD